MITYLILNVLFFLTLIMFIPTKFTKPSKAWWITLVGLLILTAIFDPIMIHLDLFGYNEAKILGPSFFGAPIEDFFYAIYAAAVVPLIWNRVGEKDQEKKSEKNEKRR